MSLEELIKGKYNATISDIELLSKLKELVNNGLTSKSVDNIIYKGKNLLYLSCEKKLHLCMLVYEKT